MRVAKRWILTSIKLFAVPVNCVDRKKIVKDDVGRRCSHYVVVTAGRKVDRRGGCVVEQNLQVRTRTEDRHLVAVQVIKHSLQYSG